MLMRGVFPSSLRARIFHQLPFYLHSGWYRKEASSAKIKPFIAPYNPIQDAERSGKETNESQNSATRADRWARRN